MPGDGTESWFFSADLLLASLTLFFQTTVSLRKGSGLLASWANIALFCTWSFMSSTEMERWVECLLAFLSSEGLYEPCVDCLCAGGI